MKDRQIAPATAGPSVFIVSTFLHCVSMSALVFLRSSFGFSFLRPKSVFFALTWAFGLYTIYAWIDGAAWDQYRARLIFGDGAFALYWIHLAVAFMREWNLTGEHDQFSGTSHAVRLMRLLHREPSAQFEAKIHLWGEPLGVLLASFVSRFASANEALSTWLLLVSVCLWSKESLNHWYRIRYQKRRADVFEDTEEAIEPSAPSNLASEPPKATRKAKVKRSRTADRAADAQEQRCAEILRLLPPYDLAGAERNYRELIKELHPDTNDSSAESTAETTELNEAIEFFRANLRA